MGRGKKILEEDWVVEDWVVEGNIANNKAAEEVIGSSLCEVEIVA